MSGAVQLQELPQVDFKTRPEREPGRVCLINWIAIGLVVVAFGLWIWRFTDWILVFSVSLGSTGTVGILADVVRRMIPDADAWWKRLLARIHQELTTRVVNSRFTWQISAGFLAAAGLLSCCAGTVLVKPAADDTKERGVRIYSAGLAEEPPEATFTINHTDVGGKKRLFLGPPFGKRSLIVHVDGYRDTSVNLGWGCVHSLGAPADFRRRVVHLELAAHILDYSKIHHRDLVLEVKSGNRLVFKGAYSGQLFWIGCDVQAAAKLAETVGGTGAIANMQAIPRYADGKGRIEFREGDLLSGAIYTNSVDPPALEFQTTVGANAGMATAGPYVSECIDKIRWDDHL